MRRRRIWLLIAGLPLALLLLVAVLPWSVFIPLVQSRAGAALGRAVHIGDLQLDLGRTTRIVLADLRIANPDGFDPEPPLLHAERMTLDLDTGALLHGRIVLPQVEIAHPALALLSPREGVANYLLDLPMPSGEDGARGPQIGLLRIQDGEARLAIAHLGADIRARFATQDAQDGGQPRLVAEAEGRYAGQPITARFTGGALLALRDGDAPWPVELRLANGPTRAIATGSLRDPLALAGAALRIELAGPDMQLLTPLTGVPIPPTPRYRITARLGHAEGRLRLDDLQGRVGRSDIAGTVVMDVRGQKPDVEIELTANRLDLADLGGFVGARPGRDAPRPAAGERVLPDTPISVPKLEAANVRLSLSARRLLGYAQPLDNLQASLTLRDAVLHVERLRFGIGRGEIAAQARIAPRDERRVHLAGRADFRRVDLGRLLRAAGSDGAGIVSGQARLDSTGRSTAELLARGNGGLTLTSAGGSLSALLVDLSGLRLGNAVFSAFGMPARTALQCFVADFALERGTLNTRAFLLETEDALISGGGMIEVGTEQIRMQLRSEAKHFTIAALPTSLIVTGSLSNPVVTPEVVELGIRGGIAAALGLAAGPLAVLPTIELGIGDDPRCNAMLERLRRPRR